MRRNSLNSFVTIRPSLKSLSHLFSAQTLKPRRAYSKTYRHVIYAVPTFANPSGRSWTLEGRRKLVELARRWNALVITDDVYDFLQWQILNTPTFNPKKAFMPRLVDIDRTMGMYSGDSEGFGNTVSNGSFSKILGPGCRTGWAEASEKFIYGLSQCGSTSMIASSLVSRHQVTNMVIVSGGSPSQLTSTFISHMLERGQLQKHIFDVLLPDYASRYRKLISAIERLLHPLGCTSRRQTIDGNNTAGGYVSSLVRFCITYRLTVSYSSYGSHYQRPWKQNRSQQWPSKGKIS